MSATMARHPSEAPSLAQKPARGAVWLSPGGLDSGRGALWQCLLPANGVSGSNRNAMELVFHAEDTAQTCVPSHPRDCPIAPSGVGETVPG